MRRALGTLYGGMTSARVADRYSLDQEIGRGGSGAVWLGRDEILGRPVALKRVGLPPGAATPDMVRAEREARLAARVNHPNVVAIFDFVEDAESHWLVMEYIDGMTLSRMIQEQGPRPADEVAAVLAQVADALTAAHEVDIVHRDVKPSNILVSMDGQVKLSDFGIARAMADATLTRTGLVTGSPAYLSPEVATGASATKASDVWSLGATMYHALAGHPPYEGDGDSNAVLGILYRIVHEDPPRLRTAGWLGPLLEMTMTKDAADRPSMAEVADYLHARNGVRERVQSMVMAGSTGVLPAVPAPPSPPSTMTAAMPPSPPAPPPQEDVDEPARSGGKRAAIIGGAVVAVLAVLGVVLVATSGEDEPPPAANTVPTESAQDTGTSDGASDDPSASASAEPPTEQELEDFATSYVQTASSDPEAGFDLLTPDFQAASNGLRGYLDFWGQVSNVEVLDTQADPDQMTVTYTYEYDYPGVGNRTEEVTLRLAQVEGALLVAEELS